MSDRWLVLRALFFATLVGAVACGDDDGGGGSDTDANVDGSTDDGGGSGGTGGTSGGEGGTSGGEGGTGAGEGGSGGTGGTGGGTGGTGGTEPVVCGGETCEDLPAQAAMLGVTRCCTDDDACGSMSPLAPVCLPPGAPGGVDPSCPSFAAGGFINWQGCCTPDGKCGALDSSEGGSGCIENSLLAVEEQSCDYDPNNTCTLILEVACDGPEDCDSGEVCCGEWQGAYTSTSCAADCAQLETDTGGIYSEICHPGATCSVDGYSCLQNTQYLPEYLYRCRDTGEEPGSAGSTAADEINCGSTVCGAGEKCCASQPGLAVCVPEDEACACTPEDSDMDGGSDDDAG